MNTENSIALEIFKNIPLSKKEVDLINSKFKKINLKKGDILLSPNTFVNNQYYVCSGCLRSYFVQKSGKEHTIQFAINDWWMSDFTAFLTSEKSIMSIECIKDATIYEICKEDLESLYIAIPKLETFFRKKLEKAFASFQKRILEYLALSAKDRYLKFINSYPEIEKSVKNYHIASYLGITSESLSRIRKTTSL